MKWSEPELIVVNMNAEIGGYQNDFDGEPRPYYRVPDVAAGVQAPCGEPSTERARLARPTE
ncbi:MAG TPA: hypothetical protein VI072_02590 [Polyangiaceae bacterium]